jgi:cell division protein FtsZ
MDLSIGEFEEVGEDRQAVRLGRRHGGGRHGHRSGDGDEIRVTVVATGLGQPAVRRQPVIHVVPPVVAPRQPEAGGRNTREPVPAQGAVYEGYDQPAWMRKRAVGDQLTDGGDTSFDLLDVPAFLRRQAD